MYRAVGLITGKVYVTGTKEHCYRTLIEMFPYKTKRKGDTKGATLNRLYKEPITITRKEDMLNEYFTKKREESS